MSEKRFDGIRLSRTTKGNRPSFFDDPALDQLMTFILELSTELAVLHERHDTLERLLDKCGSVSRADIEQFRLDGDGEAERAEWREAFLERVLRLHSQE